MGRSLEVRIRWTLEAEKDILRVYDFYVENFSEKLAQKVLRDIFSKVQKLEHSPGIGQEEELLKHIEQGQRYIISNHNKIIYKPENIIIYITHVFDTRQDPNKLKRSTG